MAEVLEESVEMSEVAEPIENEEANAEVVDTEETEGVDEKQEVTEPVIDENAKYAAARRKAEAEIKARDAEYTRRFGHLKNPITGKAIQSERDYFEALDAQEEIKRNKVLEEKGIDPAIIDQAIANNPVVRQAEMVLRQNQEQLLQNDIAEQLKMISALDPSIKSFNDLENVPDKESMLEMVQRGYSLYDAFRLSNFDSLMNRKSAAAEQKAINQAKGKSHLTPTTSGSASSDGLKEIPQSELGRWRAFFPDASMKELKEKYNRTHKD